LLDNPADATALHPNCELIKITLDAEQIRCTFRHRDTQDAFEHITGALILATGYKEQPPTFLTTIKERINYLLPGNCTSRVTMRSPATRPSSSKTPTSTVTASPRPTSPSGRIATPSSSTPSSAGIISHSNEIPRFNPLRPYKKGGATTAPLNQN
jgi:hypothetical protein